MDIKIANLAEYVDSIPLVAMWLYGELGYAQSGKTLDDMIGDLASRCHVDSLPMTFVGFSGGRTVGTVTLVDKELGGSTDYSPWVTLLFVADDARCQGMGTELLRTAAEEARKLGYDALYLHTQDQRHFYEELGWQNVQTIQYDGREEVVMKLDLKRETM